MKAEFKVSYFLWKDRAGSDGLAPVYIRSMQNSEKQIPYNTGVKMHTSQWNYGTKKRPKNEPKNKPAALLELERKLKETYRDLVAHGHEPNLTQLLEHRNDTRKPTDMGIVAWCDDYLKGQYSEGQKKAVRTLRTNFAGTEPKKRKNKKGEKDDQEKKIPGFSPSLTFDKLTKPRLKAFFEYLTLKGVANNSQYKRLRALVNVANHANIDLPHLNNYQLPYETKNALKTRLTPAEVKAIMKTETKSNLEQVAKDVFLLACFSGLRISDILSLNRGELHEYHYERVQTKTKMPVLVTVHKFNKDLFEKYTQTGVPYTRQRLSDALKDVLERSGLTKDVVKVQAVGYSHKESVKAKYEEVSFHSGRRYYSRLLNDLGLGGEIARDELGHGFKNITDLYAGSPEHTYRVARVRKAMDTLEETLEQLAALMKVA